MGKLDADQIRQLLETEFPQVPTTRIEEVGAGYARVRREIGDADLRPGGTVAGPVLMGLADMVTYVALLAEIGEILLAVTTSLNINFLRKPPGDAAIIAEARMLKVGRRIAVAEVSMTSAGNGEVLAHATVTYSIPPR